MNYRMKQDLRNKIHHMIRTLDRNGLRKSASLTRAELLQNINNVEWLRGKAASAEKIEEHFDL